MDGMLTWTYGENLRTNAEAMSHSGWTAENLRKRGLQPATVLDVGVANGTPHLYMAFPDAYLVLLEPVEEFEDAMDTWTKRDSEVVWAAIGPEDGEIEIRVDKDVPWMSSPLELMGRPQNYEARTVPLRSLDSLLAERQWTPPFGLKIDVEGFEDQVILGATELLKQTQFVIAEVSVVKRYSTGAVFADFIALMAERGFSLCDVLDAQKPDPAGPMYFVDAMFLR